MWTDEFRSLLNEQLERRRKTNRTYSIRSYAKDLGISAAAMSEFLRGKSGWKMSVDRALAIVERLQLNPAKRRRILALAGRPLAKEKADFVPSNYDILTDWTVMAVWLAFDLKPSERTPQKIAARFGISLGEVNKIIDGLLKRTLLKRNDLGEILSDKEHWMTTDGIPNDRIREHHISNMKLAISAVEQIPVRERDFNSISFAGTRSQLDVLRSEIRALLDKTMAIMESPVDENDEIYHLSISLFPLRFEGSVEK